jgi:hypothetical protein
VDISLAPCLDSDFRTIVGLSVRGILVLLDKYFALRARKFEIVVTGKNFISFAAGWWAAFLEPIGVRKVFARLSMRRRRDLQPLACAKRPCLTSSSALAF